MLLPDSAAEVLVYYIKVKGSIPAATMIFFSAGSIIPALLYPLKP
jgi:hypothetical protein